MALHRKSWRAEFVQLARAALNIENLAAGAAVEVMVVGQARRLIACRLAGDINGRQQAFFDE